MSSHDTSRPATAPTGADAVDGWRPHRPVHTPVRGHGFQVRPPGGAPLGRGPLRLRPEPDNPADPHAVAVWAEGGGRPWRVGYLERAVAVRLATTLRSGADAPVAFAGWWEEPAGRWHRPVVRLFGDARPVQGPRGALSSLPPCSTVHRRTVTGTRPASSAAHPPGSAAA